MVDELSLFVYGAFSKGMVLAHHLDRYVMERRPATVRGFIYRMPVGYPALVLSANRENQAIEGDLIPGDLIKVQAPEIVFRLLDELNGYLPMNPQKSVYLKQRVNVRTIDGLIQECFVYALNSSKLPNQAERIQGGDWQSDLAQRPTLAQTLTQRQATYIKRLSQCSGREVIPIDMTLYRELLKLELIIDKGRRLALTQLGKDVARYLS